MESKTGSFGKNITIGGELKVNRMGFGAMRITGDGVWGPPKDKEEAIRTLKRTVDLGINFIDTADSYGPDVSEELIAEALHPYPPGLVIATKGGFRRTGPGQWVVDGQIDRLQERLESSLKRLKVDRIDLYQLHRIDSKVPFEQTLEFLSRIKEKGLVKHIGLSEVSAEQIRKTSERVEVVSVQNQYSVNKRQWEKELEYCLEHNIVFIPWNPMDAGNKESLAKLEKIAEKYDATAYQVALSWLLHHAPNILLIPGTSKVKHLEENYRSIDIRLNGEDLQALDQLARG